MTCFGNGVAWEVGEAGAGTMAGGAAIFVVVVVVAGVVWLQALQLILL